MGNIYLEPIRHVYIDDETKEEFKSVTTVISELETEFQSDIIAEAIEKQSPERKKEKYKGLTKQQILDYWEEENRVANEYGTKIHNILETYLKKKKFYFPTDVEEQEIINAYDELNIDLGFKYYCERILFHRKYKIAGMTDHIVDVEPDFFDVNDYKGLAIDTPIFTDSGWKTMGSLCKKDKVYDKDGELCGIKNLSTIKYKKCYKINFNNNESIVSDFEHRWLISFVREKKVKDILMTTEELYHYISKFKLLPKKHSWNIPKIKISEPLKNNQINLPIDPYVLGIWLGDGNSADSKITNMNSKIWDEIEHRGYKLGKDVSGGSSGKAETKTIFELLPKLRGLNLLFNKHLPEIYLLSSYEQRLDLLRGFMDSDGYYNKTRGRFVMSTTKKWQVDATVQLLSSLGIKTTVISAKKYCNNKIFPGYDVCFTTKINPFLCRNTEINFRSLNNRWEYKNIMSVEEVDSVPTRCIEVDSKSNTFLYGYTFSVTHNTNKVINYYSPYGNKLLKPVNFLDDCQYNLYALQLSIYAYFYEVETGKRCRQMRLLYYDRILKKFQIIPVPYMKMEAIAILENYIKNV